MQAIPNASDILQAVIDATPDAIFVKDLEGRYVLVNQAAARFVGRTPAEVDRQARSRALSRRNRAPLHPGRPGGARRRPGDVVRGCGVERVRHAGVSGDQGRLPRSRRAHPRHLRHLARHHGAARRAGFARADARGAVPLAEDGSRRPADRRHRARLQQHPDGDSRQPRAAAHAAAGGGRSDARADRRNAARHQARPGSHRRPAGVLAPPAVQSAAGGRQRARREHRPHARPHAGREHSHQYRREPRRRRGAGRPRRARSGDPQHRAERARCDAGGRHADHPHVAGARSTRRRARKTICRSASTRCWRSRTPARACRPTWCRASSSRSSPPRPPARQRPRPQHGLRLREAIRRRR